jgi:N-acetylneuraminate synthase
MLEKLHCPAYKIASFELVDLGLIDNVAATGKPVILSTGMATQSEIEEAVTVLQRHPATPYMLLHCVSSYPAPIDQANLNTLPLLNEIFSVPVGLSDHTRGSTAAITAVALGACVIEKHFMLSRSDGGVDSEFSLEPGEFRQMANAAREAWRALGEARIGTADAESDQTRFRRSLYIVAPVRQGEAFTNENVRSIRPANGLHPRYLQSVIGRRATRDIAYGEPLDWEMIAD